VIIMRLSLGLFGSLALTGCPGEEETNAPTLWLAPDGAETRVRLIEDRPPPF
jgi:hypothetical protein